MFGLFRNDGAQDPLYEDKETRVSAGKFGYILETGIDTSFHAKHHGPLKEREMIKLLGSLDTPRRSRIAKAISDHADEFPKYRE